MVYNKTFDRCPCFFFSFFGDKFDICPCLGTYCESPFKWETKIKIFDRCLDVLMQRIRPMRIGWVSIPLLWGGCGMAWNSILLLYSRLFSSPSKFRTLLQNIFLISIMFLGLWDIWEVFFFTKQYRKSLSKYYSGLENHGISSGSISPLLLIWSNKHIRRNLWLLH